MSLLSVLATVGKIGGGVIGGVGYIGPAIQLAEIVFAQIGKANAGGDKKELVKTLVKQAILTGEGISQKDIIDEDKFTDGLDKAVDGVVAMLNASVWYKK